MLDDAMPALSGKGKASMSCREDAMGNRIAPIGATIKALVEEFWNEDVPKVTRLSRCTQS